MSFGNPVRRTSATAVICLGVATLAAMTGAVGLYLRGLLAVQAAQGLNLPVEILPAAKILGGCAGALGVLALIFAFGARTAIAEGGGAVAGKGILGGALLMVLLAVGAAVIVF